MSVMTQLEEFVSVCMLHPSLLHAPELAFLKSFVEHFGGKIPKSEHTTSAASNKSKPANESKEAEPKPEPESDESDLELDMTGVIEPDIDVDHKMGNPTLQPTEEEIAESQGKRSEAVSAFVEKDYEKAIQLYTEAIVLNPQAALLYAKRGQVFLLIDKPNACIRDCNRALELNPDSAAAHKFRGRAYHLLGKFEDAANDLRLACKFDFDEQADEWLREVTPNARKIEEQKRKKARKLLEKAEQEIQEKLKHSHEGVQTCEDDSRPSEAELNGEFISDFYKFFTDPEIAEAFRDREMINMFNDMSTNRANILKYQYNPKVMRFVTKMARKFGGAKDAPGMMSGMPGFSGTEDAPSATPDPKSQDDVGLD